MSDIIFQSNPHMSREAIQLASINWITVFLCIHWSISIIVPVPVHAKTGFFRPFCTAAFNLWHCQTKFYLI